jgi:hypothetical protein
MSGSNVRVVRNVVSVMAALAAKHWLWLPDDGFMLIETCWSSFYNSNCFDNLTF